MKWTGLTGLMLLAAFAATDISQAAEGRKFWEVQNRFRVEYDDNIYQTTENTTESIKLIDDIFLSGSVVRDQTFFAVKYRPAIVYWFDRPSDDLDLTHELLVDLNQKFTPQLALTVKDRFLIQELPELIDNGTPIQADSGYSYNDLVAALNYRFRPSTDLDLSGRWDIIRYDEDVQADLYDNDRLVVGLTLNHFVVPETSVSGDLRLEDVSYDTAESRDAESTYLGLGVSQSFSPNLLGSLRGGYQFKQFDDDAIEDNDSPYADLGVTWVPAAATRVSAGLGYAMESSYIAAYANQTRLQYYATLAHDFTAKIAWYLSGNFTDSSYDANEAVVADAVDADEDIVLISTRVTYRLDTSNWLEFSYSYTDVASEIRREYDRSRVSVGWRVQI